MTLNPLRALCAAVALCAAADTVAFDDDAYLHAQRRIEVEPGRRLNLYCTGTGVPAVVLEAGMTDPTNVWGMVQPRVATAPRVCSYDRAGIGFSDPARRPSSSANIADDLHHLLHRAGIAPPYVLVAQSSGGLHARQFAAMYPREVAGMVLVSPCSEYQTDSYRKLDPRQLSMEEWQRQVVGAGWGKRQECIDALDAQTPMPGSELFEKCTFPQYPQFGPRLREANTRMWMTVSFQRAQLSEEQEFTPSQLALQQMPRDLGDMPLIVLTEAPRAPPNKPLPPDQLALRRARDELWMKLNKDIAAWSRHGEQRVVADAGHQMHLESPQLVADTIIEVWRAANATRR